MNTGENAPHKQVLRQIEAQHKANPLRRLVEYLKSVESYADAMTESCQSDGQCRMADCWEEQWTDINHVRNRLEQALAEMPSQQGWQLIETAPQDGRDVLLYDLRERIHIGSFRTDANDEDGAPLWLANDHDDYSCGLASTPISATHWMPLPEPPTQNEKSHE